MTDHIDDLVAMWKQRAPGAWKRAVRGWSVREERIWVRAVEKLAEEISDEELFELHRRISRLATRARQRDPEYQQRQRMGNLAARAARAR